MAEQLPTLTIPPERRPSFLNSGIFKGALIALPLMVISPITAGGTLLLGSGIGSVLRRRDMKQEEQNGVQVPPPTARNKSMVFGALLGIATIGAMAFAGASILGVALAGWPLVGFMAGAAVVGGGLFGQISKAFQSRKYRAAEAHVMQYGEYVPPPTREQMKAQQQTIAMGQGQSLQQAPRQQAPQSGLPGQRADLGQLHQQMNTQQLAQLQALAAEGRRMAPPQPESMADKVGHSRPQGPQAR